MEEQFSPQQSLQLIQSMIAKARQGLNENRFYFLLWGWTAFSCFVIQFLLKVALDYPHHYLVWLATIVAAVITVVRARRQGSSGTRTYVGDGMSYLWTGLGISFFLMSFVFMSSPQGFKIAYPMYILLYGLGTYVSGRLLQFRPLVIGGLLNWALALLCTFVPLDYQLLVAAAAIVVSYIIPGHLIKPNS